MLSSASREAALLEEPDVHAHAVSKNLAFQAISSHRPDGGNGMLVDLRGAQHTRRLLSVDKNVMLEGLFGIVGGMAYGLAGPVLGHPLDTVKTKMQGEVKFRTSSATAVMRSIAKTDGVKGFYKGIVPNLAGSAVFGGIVLGAYKFASISCKDTGLGKAIPGTGGLEGGVLVGGLVASAARASVETPLALMKVRQQVGHSWNLQGSPHQRVRILDYWKGAGPTFFRCWGMLGTFFVMVDYSERYFPEIVNTPVVGPFVKGGVCASIGWIVAWPMETVKSRVQADVTGDVRGSTFKVMRDIIRTEGVRSVYRGLGLGLSKSFMSNGMAMLALELTNKLKNKYTKRN